VFVPDMTSVESPLDTDSFPSLNMSASLARSSRKGAEKVAKQWQVVAEPEPIDDWEIVEKKPVSTVWNRDRKEPCIAKQ
jgi:hypothetical protein